MPIMADARDRTETEPHHDELEHRLSYIHRIQCDLLQMID